MGTLYDQRPRELGLADYFTSVLTIAGRMGYDPDQMSPAQWEAAANVTRTCLCIQNSNVLDEQLGGLGEELQKIAGAIESLKGDQ